jgi:hypothetical protein
MNQFPVFPVPLDKQKYIFADKTEGKFKHCLDQEEIKKTNGYVSLAT